MKQINNVYRDAWYALYRSYRTTWNAGQDSAWEMPFPALQRTPVLEQVIPVATLAFMAQVNNHFDKHQTHTIGDRRFDSVGRSCDYMSRRRRNLAAEIIRINYHKLEERYAGTMQTWHVELKNLYRRVNIPGERPPPSAVTTYRKPVTTVMVTKNPK